MQEHDDADRWDRLADDVDGEADALETAEIYAQSAEATRNETATFTFTERLRGAIGREVVVCVRGAGPLRGVLGELGRDWLLLVDGPRETTVRLVAVLSVTGAGPSSASRATTSPIAAGLGVGHVVRRHVTDRAVVRLVLDTGDVFTGTLDLAGSDHVELAEHPVDEPRRAGVVVARRLVPFDAIATIARGRLAGET